MDVVLLSRLQFAATTMFHFLFVPLTLGLSFIIAYMETKYVRTNNELYLKMTKFWGKLFLINFTMGVITGIPLEFQFGTNWSKYSTYVGDIFGSILAIEASAAFFLESVFIGVWVFGWNKLSAKQHAIIAWLIAIGGIFSALWILIANGWMQNPVGFTLNNNGQAELTNFIAIITNKFAILEIIHTIPASFLLSSFFVMGISSWHLLKKQHIQLFEKSFKIALTLGLVSSIIVAATGDQHGVHIAKVQPAKLAAMEATWETQTNAPITLFAIPDEKQEKNKFIIGKIPGALSLLAHHKKNAEVIGLKFFSKDERPPVLLTFIAFRIMVGIGTALILLTLIGFWLRNKLIKSRMYLWIILFSIPLPYIAIEMGWVLAEVGRQPWIAYGLLKTSEAVSPISTSQVTTTLIGFIITYSFLGVLGAYLIIKSAKNSEQIKQEK